MLKCTLGSEGDVDFLVVGFIKAVEQGIVALNGRVGADSDAGFRKLVGTGSVNFCCGQIHVEGDDPESADRGEREDRDEPEHRDEGEAGLFGMVS